MPRKIIIDTDPGTDDAVAILLALSAPEALEVVGIVAVAGNLPLAVTERNARRICALAGRPDVPVYAGCDQPLQRAPVTAEHVYGDTGLGGLVLPEPVAPLQPDPGVDFLIETLRRAVPGTITLCALGPLTNIAAALLKAPGIAERIGAIVAMGGAGAALGNITPAAEFNIFADPHAASYVLESGVKLTMIPLDATHQALGTPERVARLAALGNRCGIAAATLTAPPARPSRRFGGAASPLHDPCVIAYLLHPELFGGRELNVAVETESPLTLGMTVIDYWGVTGRPANVRFIDEIDADGVFARLAERIARLP